MKKMEHGELGSIFVVVVVEIDIFTPLRARIVITMRQTMTAEASLLAETKRTHLWRRTHIDSGVIFSSENKNK